MEKFKAKLNFFFTKNLKTKTSITTISFEVSPSVASQLTSMYELNYHRYKISEDLIKDSGLTTKRHINEHNYNELLGARFKLRRNKLTFFKDASLCPQVLHGPTQFCMRMYVLKRVTIK